MQLTRGKFCRFNPYITSLGPPSGLSLHMAPSCVEAANSWHHCPGRSSSPAIYEVAISCER